MTITVPPRAPAPTYARPQRPVPTNVEEFAFAPSRLTVTALGDLVRRLGDDPHLWQHRLEYDEHERWFTLLRSEHLYDVWLLSWAPGQSTTLHDHGGSSGAFHVLQGTVTETIVRPEPVSAPVARRSVSQVQDRDLTVGDTAAFGPRYVHDVRHGGNGPAATLHVYSPPLTSMTYYETVSGPSGSVVRPVQAVQTDVPEPTWTRRAGHESVA